MTGITDVTERWWGLKRGLMARHLNIFGVFVKLLSVLFVLQISDIQNRGCQREVGTFLMFQ